MSGACKVSSFTRPCTRFTLRRAALLTWNGELNADSRRAAANFVRSFSGGEASPAGEKIPSFKCPSVTHIPYSVISIHMTVPRRKFSNFGHEVIPRAEISGFMVGSRHFFLYAMVRSCSLWQQTIQCSCGPIPPVVQMNEAMGNMAGVRCPFLLIVKERERWTKTASNGNER
jgi:hypothetical protein